MRIIGLTGGIGAGKSTVSNYLKEKRGAVILDADKFAREITNLGSPVLSALAEAFGRDILFENGQLNRKKLAAIAFSDAEKKRLLDSITHGEICRRIAEGIEQAAVTPNIKLAVIDAPLLFEAGLDKSADVVWVVDAEDEVRMKRLIKRDCLTEEEISARINNQMGREEKIAKADVVLNNSGNEDALYRQIDALLDSYV